MLKNLKKIRPVFLPVSVCIFCYILDIFFILIYSKYITILQEEIYEGTTKNLVQDVLNGYNATVFAYGATGSGKTHTMVGMSSNPGIMVRALNDIFLAAKKLSDDAEFTVSSSKKNSLFSIISFWLLVCRVRTHVQKRSLKDICLQMAPLSRNFLIIFFIVKWKLIFLNKNGKTDRDKAKKKFIYVLAQDFFYISIIQFLVLNY